MLLYCRRPQVRGSGAAGRVARRAAAWKSPGGGRLRLALGRLSAARRAGFASFCREIKPASERQSLLLRLVCLPDRLRGQAKLCGNTRLGVTAAFSRSSFLSHPRSTVKASSPASILSSCSSEASASSASEIGVERSTCRFRSASAASSLGTFRANSRHHSTRSPEMLPFCSASDSEGRSEIAGIGIGICKVRRLPTMSTAAAWRSSRFLNALPAFASLRR